MHIDNAGQSHANYLNTPRLVADATGTTVWRWDQAEPFGDSPADENPSGAGTFDLPLRFAGQYYDAESGLHYNYFRDYDPSLGIYKQSDLIGLRGEVNTYAYVRGHPLIGTDEFGLYDCTYSIAAHTMNCQPNFPGHPQFSSSNFVSGNNQSSKCSDCQNNPKRTGVPNHGPLPTGDYSVGPQHKGSSRRDLSPLQGTRMAGRFGMQVHGCGNPQTCSDGCIAATKNKVRDQFNSFMGLEEGHNTMHVTP